MKKFLTLFCLILLFSGIQAQVRFTRVNPQTDQITLKNFGVNAVNISDWRLCSLFDYTANLTASPVTVVSGSLNIAPGDSVTIGGWPLNNSGADLNIYLATGDFSEPAAMVDFMQWGSGGNGREPEAVSKGLWGAGQFIAGNAPYRYTGNGAQNGLQFWQATADPTSLIRFIYVDPASDEIHIKNFGTTTVNIAAYRLCSQFNYAINLTDAPVALLSGSLNLGPGDTVRLSGWPIADAAADLGLFLPDGAFANPNAMLDFLQWGSAGNGQESVAVMKGIWSAGDFITGNAPFSFTGSGTQHGLSFWQVSTGIFSDLTRTGYLSAYPNPATEGIRIRLDLPAATRDQVSLRMYDIQGREVRRIARIPGGDLLIERGTLVPGTYYVSLRDKNRVIATEKIRFE